MHQSENAATPDTARPVTIDEIRPAPAQAASGPGRLPVWIAMGAVLLAMAALGLAGWTYNQGRSEILRLSTELAQLRVSLDLYARAGGDTADLSDVQARLSALEQASPQNTISPAPVVQAQPATSAPASGANDGDCLPVGMRLLVAAGDIYPVCGQTALVNVGSVDNGYITLADGTSVASGGTMPLADSACMIAVTSGGDEGLTGYAEIRVSC